MSKKGKRGNNTMEVYSTYTIADDKARSKYENLLQDYHDLLNEAEAKKRILQKMNQKKRRLYNEVRFLQKRYRKLMKNPSQQSQCVLLKRRSVSIVSKLRKHDSSQVRSDAVLTETPSTSIEASMDLNQSSLQCVNMESEGDEYYLMQGNEKENTNYDNMYGEEEETTLACRDLGGTSSSRAGKRKISWQDQYALKV